jgi:hypothetical protein
VIEFLGAEEVRYGNDVVLNKAPRRRNILWMGFCFAPPLEKELLKAPDENII